MKSYFGSLAEFDNHHTDGVSARFDDELQTEVIESQGWGDDYEGGFVYTGDESMYEGLTILDRIHIDGRGSVSAMPLYNWE